jgi:hypothetical protein
MPPVTCHVGAQKAPLFLSYRHTLRRPSLYLPSQSEAVVVLQKVKKGGKDARDF